MATCRRCGDWQCTGIEHRCDPAWTVWCPDLGQSEEDGKVIYAMSEGTAAEKWAAWSDAHSADYDIVGGSPATVHVRYTDDLERAQYLRLPTDELVFEVYGESVPSYHAQPSRRSHSAKDPK